MILLSMILPPPIKKARRDGIRAVTTYGELGVSVHFNSLYPIADMCQRIKSAFFT
jgi:hypothetical protein